ncbi:trypsin [Actinoplanes sp. ATCC 53533]|uniref:S1 family peptidase n=1 Tax=Actinoplanes sp. ATCC 53533 TaxID=1288362 RepID=UPI000F76C6F2|nr:trypsin-like serine protease [Actinoplanes sp. ATCC 53533]RSM40086.1 trypsin [Actinoplanes sp. ATCC 53533]
MRSLRRCLVIILLVGALTAAPASIQPASAIAYGEDVRAGAYRFSVLLTMTGLPTGAGTRDSSCSGALVAPRWVITAGHCFRTAAGRRVSRLVAARTTATVGRADLRSKEGHQAEVVTVRQAETADVALVEIDTAITDIAPLRIGTAPPAAGEVVRLTGYGLIVGDESSARSRVAAGRSDGESASTERLQTGQFVVGRVNDSLIETSGKAPRASTSPCPHDSGGPYFRQQQNGAAVLVAVVSSGPGCPHEGADFSARTDNLADWIASTTGGLGARDRYLIGYGLSGLVALVAVLMLVLVVRWRRRRAFSVRPPAWQSSHRTSVRWQSSRERT